MSKKKKKSNLRPLLTFILLIINILAAVPLLLSFCAQFVPPTTSLVVAYCGLLFPYLLYANIAFCLLWIFVNYKFTLLSLLLILLNISNIDKHFQFKPTSLPEKCLNCVKVMSFNVKLFDFYDETLRESGREQILEFLRRENPDIVCFQEYFYENSPRVNFPTTDSILSILNLEENGKYHFQHFPRSLNNAYFYGVATFSRYKILDAAPISFPENSSNTATYIDIKYKSDTLRIYNVHLASIHMEKGDYEVGRNFSADKLDDPDFNKNAKSIYKKIGAAFEKRKEQVDILRAHMDSCRFPIILCGDFNDTPASYSYNQIARKLSDTFRSSGAKTATTYNGNSIPAYRIDYILHDKQYRSYQHTVCRDIAVSDHFPIISYISLQKKQH